MFSRATTTTSGSTFDSFPHTKKKFAPVTQKKGRRTKVSTTGCLRASLKFCLLCLLLVCILAPFFFVHITVDYTRINGVIESLQHFPSVKDISAMAAKNIPFSGLGGQHRYAYAWLLAGVHPDKPGYRGFLYTIMICMNLLRQYETKADFVVYVQLSPDSAAESLPAHEHGYLEKLGAQVIYVDKPKVESFATAVYEKFRPLQLTQYERVLFIDADIIPLRNFDYLMEASIEGTIGQNFIIATRGEPCNAAFFMLKPDEDSWDKLQEIVEKTKERGAELPYPHFDKYEGWGHNFYDEMDNWEAISASGKKWVWHAVHSDQGLLYYWTKYVKQDVTIAIGKRIQRWKPGDNNKPILEKEASLLLDEIASETERECNDIGCYVPYRHWIHFAGSAKPWTKKRLRKGPAHKLWFHQLTELNKKFDMRLPINDWDEMYKSLKEPPLGEMALWIDHAVDVGAVSENDANLEKTRRKMKVAYAWLIGGVHQSRPGYRGFLYNALISIERLKRFNSVADFIVYIQLSPDNPKDALPPEEERFFRELGASIIYLERPKSESFAAVVYEKFRPLQLTHYDRVIFMDGDLMPHRNLDYLMEVSLDGIIGPNFIMATRGEPCNAAFFMLQPQEGAYEELQAIIQQQFEKGKELPYPHFDRFEGWGHNFIERKDHWEAVKRKGARWNWHAVHSDQGLLFYWVKYYKMNTTIFIGEKVQTWVPGPTNGSPKLYTEGNNLLDAYAEPRSHCNIGRWACAVPYRDWVHFSGSKKPWTQEVLSDKDRLGRKTYHIEWFADLRKLSQDLNMGISNDWTEIYDELKDPPLGAMALWVDHANHVGMMNETEVEENKAMRANSDALEDNDDEE